MEDQNKKIEELEALLKKAYIFIGMPHKALNPWRITLDEWLAKVEAETGWNHFEELINFEKNKN